jgi:hypothetical protein
MKLKKPDFQEAMQLMRQRAEHRREEGFLVLKPFAAEFVEELMGEYRAEQDHGLKCWLLELVAMARSEKAFDFLVEQLNVRDLTFRELAIDGLRKLNTAESKKVLKVRGF